VRLVACGGGDIEAGQVRPAEGSLRRVPRGNLDHLGESAFGRIPADGAAAPEGDPQVALRVDDQPVRHTGPVDRDEPTPVRRHA